MCVTTVTVACVCMNMFVHRRSQELGHLEKEF